MQRCPTLKINQETSNEMLICHIMIIKQQDYFKKINEKKKMIPPRKKGDNSYEW